MHGTQPRDTRITEPLQGAQPQVKVWIHRILDQHSDFVMPLQLIGDILNSKRVGGCACSNPQNIDAGI